MKRRDTGWAFVWGGIAFAILGSSPDVADRGFWFVVATTWALVGASLLRTGGVRKDPRAQGRGDRAP